MANPLVAFDGNTLALVRRTVAKDCSDDELRLFIHMCKHLGLDPLRREVYAFVFGKDAKDRKGNPDPSKRNLSLVVGIQGYRKIAAATGNYRGDDKEPEIHLHQWMEDRQAALNDARKVAKLDERKKQFALIDELYPIDPLNPEGIERAVVSVWQHAHGEWHRVPGVAYWAEHVPLKEEWAEPDGGGRARPTGKVSIDPKKGNWLKMPRLMLAKIAEAAALRKAWPDNFSNVYEEAEIDREASRLDVVEAIALSEEQARAARAARGARCIMIDFGHDTPIESVSVDHFSRRCLAFIEENAADPAKLDSWWSRNRNALREFHGTPDRKIEAVKIGQKIDEVMTAAKQIEAKKPEEQAAA